MKINWKGILKYWLSLMFYGLGFIALIHFWNVDIKGLPFWSYIGGIAIFSFCNSIGDCINKE